MEQPFWGFKTAEEKKTGLQKVKRVERWTLEPSLRTEKNSDQFHNATDAEQIILEGKKSF